MIRKTKKTEGFTLIEVAIAMVILGALVAGVLRLYERAEEQRRVRVTEQHMERIVNALSIYAETASRIPCPADPAVTDVLFGWEYGVTAATLAGGRPLGGCANTPVDLAFSEGIVPFQTLGIHHSVAKDGWGRYFTYAVSPVFAQNNDRTGGSETAVQVHERCRNRTWVQEGDDGAGNPVDDNVNATKARFCCAGDTASFATNTDLRIQLHTDSGGPAQDISPIRNTGNYGAVDVAHENGDGVVIPVRSDVSTQPITAPAFVLISHGENGLGAYLGNDSLNRFGTAGTPEDENTNGDRLYFTGRRDNDFDDFVIWMTQDGIMAANGTSSCQYP